MRAAPAKSPPSRARKLSGCLSWCFTITPGRKASTASGICSIHHVPLKKSIVYSFSHFDIAVLDASAAEHRAQGKYPNSLPYWMRRTASPDFHSRETAMYCPACQERYERETQ